MKTSIFLKVIEKSASLIENYEYLIRSRLTANCFNRNKKMNFTKIMYCLLNFIRKTLALEVLKFNKLIGNEDFNMTKQAFSTARKQINPEAFKELMNLSVDTFLEEHDCEKYKGYRLFAIDGTTLNIPKTINNLEYYGAVKNICQARASILCELHSSVIIDSQLSPIKVGEGKLAKKHLKKYFEFAGNKDLVIFDRAYASRELIEQFVSNNSKYLMRVQRKFNKEIDNSTKEDFYITLDTLNGKKLKVRVIKFVLESGETESLITNLSRTAFKKSDFEELYFMRWGVESKYNTLKNKILIEHFSGKSKICIEQDFYATMYLTNLVALAKLESDEVITSNNLNSDLKYEYHTNEKMLIGCLKDELILLLLCSDNQKRKVLFEKLIATVSKFKSEIKPGRSAPRNLDAHHKRKPSQKLTL